MKSKRTIIFIIAIVLTIALLTCLLTACDLFGSKNNDNDGNETPPEHEHIYGDWRVETPATCTTTGIRRKYCECGEYIEETIGALGHVEVIDGAVAPTCTETGLTEGKHCSRCQAILVAQQTVNKLGHNYVDGVCTRCREIDPNYQAVDPEEVARLERVQLESDIETKLLDMLNENFGEDYVDSVDIRYFTIEQDSQLNTTLYANGSIKFPGDTSVHTVQLGFELVGDDIVNLSPLYYVETYPECQLSMNYTTEDL